MVLFFVDKVTPRWEYTLEFIFGIRDVAYELTDDANKFTNANSLKFQIPCNFGRLLFHREINAHMQEQDLLSKLFFVLTRMEEYHPIALDKLGRYSAKESWQFKNGCLDKCVCDDWANEFIHYVEEQVGVNLSAQKPKTTLIPTFDIDNAFAYKFKSGKRKILSKVKDIVFGNFGRLKERKQVLSGQEEDPYDSYVKMEEICKKHSTCVFWLVGDYGDKDFNISIETQGVRKLVDRFQSISKIGVHPSYLSNSKPELLSSEISRLNEVVKTNIEISRQHFLKLRFPETYQNLIKNGIKADYTMGFPDAVGFRNGTAQPFPWFDLSKNEKTELIIYPFAYMDGTLHEYLELTADESKEIIHKLYLEVEKQGGQFSFIWHNETISNYGKWEGWQDVLDYTLTLTKSEKV
jgi:hypothetical protein